MIEGITAAEAVRQFDALVEDPDQAGQAEEEARPHPPMHVPRMHEDVREEADERPTAKISQHSDVPAALDLVKEEVDRVAKALKVKIVVKKC